MPGVADDIDTPVAPHSDVMGRTPSK
jgi:hypothetical protein